MTSAVSCSLLCGGASKAGGRKTTPALRAPVIGLGVASVRCVLPLLLRFAHPLRHRVVLCGDRCPTHSSRVPAIVADRHVDAAIDQKLHGLVIFVPYQLMQDAGGLM